MKDDFSRQFIQSTINRFYSLISDDVSAEGSPNSRYKSWDWCHRAFLEGKDRYSKLSEKEKSDVVDYLSLHLGFYLASWGMYRGSSFLLQRDYKTHKSVVEEILKDDYDILWDFSPSENINGKAVNLLFGKKEHYRNSTPTDENTGLYWKIVNIYRTEEQDDIASDTLATKILMGTFACIPAFDRFFKAGINWYKKSEYGKTCNITTNIANKGITYRALIDFAEEKKDVLACCNNTVVKYPLMKCIDMFFGR